MRRIRLSRQSNESWTGNWPIENCLGKIEEMARLYRREDLPEGFTEGHSLSMTEEQNLYYRAGVLNALYMAKMNVESVNEIRPPDPPTAWQDFLHLTRDVRNHLSGMLETISSWVEAPNDYDR